MPDTRTYYPFLLSAFLLIVGVVCLYPFCQYYVDPDATAYLTIAQRYASGDFARAVNGYWSPWSCWLTALLVKTGLPVIPASIIINTIAAAGVLLITQSFFILFDMQRRLQTVLAATLALFLCYAVYKQNFADLWQCFFLLLSLRIMLVDGYKHKMHLWVLNGAVGALAYFSKAYAFPFFILNTLCCGFYITGAWQKPQRVQWIKMSVIAIAAMAICSSPWIYLLHDKYGIWTTSTAGSLNASWYLVGHPYWQDGIHTLLPPVYSNSPYYWEDPYIANGITPHFWSSPYLFGLQLLKVGYNLLKLVACMSSISACFLVVWLLAASVLLSDKLRYFFDEKMPVLALSFLLFPLGFLIINYEARYIWYMLPLSIVIGGLALQRILQIMTGRKILPALLLTVFAGSYLVWPLWDMRSIAGNGRDEYKIAGQLQQLGIKGSFTTAIPHSTKTQAIARLAYFSGNSYYMIPNEATPADILADMRRYKVKYYLQYKTGIDVAPFADENGRPFKEVTGGTVAGIKVFEVNP